MIGDRRLEDRVKKLCKRLIEAEDGSEDFRQLAIELRRSTTECMERLRTKLQTYPPPHERRGRSGPALPSRVL
jgi:hypothetical protein